MVNSSLQQIIKQYHENHLSHAFLIETNNQKRVLNELKKVLSEMNCETKYKENCKECNLCHLIETEQLPSFVILSPDGQTIKKSQILELKQKFSTKPIFSKYNMYVILNSEKFNASSANTLLKFLEEPEDKILGFFITNNKENIIDTIKSRCQLISAFYSDETANDELLSIAVPYLKAVHESNDFTLKINREYFDNQDLSKDSYQKLFQSFLDIYYNLYKVSFGMEKIKEEYQELSFLLKKDYSFFLKQMNLVEEMEQKLGYNVNVSLLLDRFVLETRS